MSPATGFCAMAKRTGRPESTEQQVRVEVHADADSATKCRNPSDCYLNVCRLAMETSRYRLRKNSTSGRRSAASSSKSSTALYWKV